MNNAEIARAIDTIKNRSTIAAVASHLRAKGLHHTATSWAQMIEARLKPYLDSGALSLDDVRTLLRDAENYGNQHIFLYEPNSKHPGPQVVLDTKAVSAYLSGQGWTPLLQSAKVIGKPSSITLVDIDFTGSSLSFKFVEPRKVVKKVRQEVANGTLISDEEEIVRAVDVVNILADGTLEFGIESHDGTQDYEIVVETVWNLLDGFIAKENYRPKSLDRVKRAFTINPSEEVIRLVRVRRARGTDGDGFGYTLVAMKPSGNIIKAANVVQGIGRIAGGMQSQAGATSVGFLKSEDGTPSRELGVIFPNAINEYRILLNCTKAEHEYIRDHIRKYSD